MGHLCLNCEAGVPGENPQKSLFLMRGDSPNQCTRPNMLAIHFWSKMTHPCSNIREGCEIMERLYRHAIVERNTFVLLCSVTKNYLTWHVKSGPTAGGELLPILISAVWYGSPCVLGGLHTQLCFSIWLINCDRLLSSDAHKSLDEERRKCSVWWSCWKASSGSSQILHIKYSHSIWSWIYFTLIFHWFP